MTTLLPPRHGRRPLGQVLRRTWAAASRTRPFAAPPPRGRAGTSSSSPSQLPHHGIWGSSCLGDVGELVYRGVGVWAALGICYVVGLVGGPIAGAATASSLLVAAITSLLTGYCLCELVTACPQSSGAIYTVTYQLTGELPAFIVGTLNLCFHASALAAIAKATSATVDFMFHHKLSGFIASYIGILPITHIPPDLLAAVAAIAVSALMAIGLEQSGFLRTVMNICVVLVMAIFVGVGSLHSSPSSVPTQSDGPVAADAIGSHELLAGAAVSMLLFSHNFDLSRRCKAHRRPRRTLPVAVSVATGLIFLVFFTIGIVFTLKLPKRLVELDGAPLLTLLELQGVPWASLLTACLQMILLFLGLVEAEEPLSRQLVALGADGLLPPQLAAESHRFASQSMAHITGGLMAALFGLMLGHVLILEVMCSFLLCLNVIVIMMTLYRRYRCSYASLCTVSATSASASSSPTQQYSYHKLAPKDSHQERTLQFLKDGLRVLPVQVKLKEFQTTSCSNQENGSMMTSSIEENKDTLPLLHLNDQVEVAVGNQQTRFLGNSTNDPQQENSQADLSDEEVSEASGYETDTDTETDIDAAVAEYQEKLKVATVDHGAPRTPTLSSARKALFIIIGLVVCFTVAASLVVYGWADTDRHPVLVVLLTAVILAGIFLLALLARLPILRMSHITSFKVPASPWLPAASLLLNIFLLIQMLCHTWPILLLYFFAAILCYIVYGIKHSALVNCSVVTARKLPNSEVIWLDTIAPQIGSATPFQLMEDQTQRFTQVDTVLIQR
ncbi:unnamed protein product [Meganyctiphanes norvegica]|uniref:Cationic amino acid transporter C-terminal domain-containing protein n=1 Tax=Meganyctiphanes norvegica TaxID=48144 RepID=A0AAV2PRY7_MEGNR